MSLSAVKTPNTFFMHDRANGGPSPLSEYFPHSRVWERGIFYTKSLNAPYYLARATKQRAIVIGCSGLNTHNLLGEREVKRLLDLGITFIWMALPKVDHNKPMLDDYLDLAKEFITSKGSPVHTLLQDDMPRYLLTYSTGGQLIFHLMHDPSARRQLCAIFSGAVHVSPYFDTAHASRDHSSKFSQWLFTKYMSLKKDVPPHMRRISKAYMSLNELTSAFTDAFGARPNLGEPHQAKEHSSKLENWLLEKYSAMQRRVLLAQHYVSRAKIGLENWQKSRSEPYNDIHSTCGQILELKERGQKLTSSENFNVAAASGIPSIFVIGDRDNFACPLSSQDVGEKIGAEILLAEGGYHDPLRTHPQLMDVFLGKVEECIAKREEVRAKTVYISAQKSWIEHAGPAGAPLDIKYTLMDDLRYRAGLALQSGTGLLYSSARLFQGLG